MGSSLTGTSSSISDTIYTRLAGANIKLETEQHCFVVREQLSYGDESVTERQTLFAQKYLVRVGLIQADLQNLRMVEITIIKQ